MNYLKNILKKCFPYLMILVFSLIGGYLVFFKGINSGDDYRFHFANIIEQYETLLTHHSLSPISGIIANGLGSGTRLFYSPLPHLSVALLSLFYRLYGGSIVLAYKTILIFTIFISGVFMYHFAMHISKNNQKASLIAAACFVLYPYRLFDAFCRLAFAEAYSIAFLPLFFMGLYDVVHIKDKIQTIPFLEIIFGGSLLFLSHTITAFYAFLAGIIYLLFNIHRIIPLFKKPKYIAYCVVAIFLLAGIGSISYITQFELINLNIYNICDAKRMWTDIPSVVSHTQREWSYSGFLNISFLVGSYGNIVNEASLIIGSVLYVFGCGIFVICDIALKDTKYFKKFHLILSSILLFIIVSIVDTRLEIYLATAIFYLLYLYIVYFPHKKEDIEQKDVIYKNNLFWYSIFMILLLLLMMNTPFVWEHLPEFMLKIQFPWRLWALVQLYIAILTLLIAHYVSFKKIGLLIMACFVGFLMAITQPLVEKRLAYETNNTNIWHAQLDENLVKSGVALGFNKEYCPQVFFDSSYRPKYSRTLYYIIKNRLPYDMYQYETYSIDPLCIQGNSKIVVNDAFSPSYDMSIQVSSDSAIIQMPLIYYPGYEIEVKNTKTNQVYTLNGENVDGLVTFTLSKGEFEVQTKYVGTPARRFSFVWFGVSLSASMMILIYAIIFENKKERNLWLSKK